MRDELAAHKAASTRTRPDDLVFTTRTGAPRDRYNLRQRVVLPVAREAAELLDARDAQPLPAGVSPHKLGHTFASILVALGSDPASVMAQIGHTDPALTLRVYTHMMRRDQGERDPLRALVEGRGWAAIASGAAVEASDGSSATVPENDESPATMRLSEQSGRPDLNRGPHRPASWPGRRRRAAQKARRRRESPVNTNDFGARRLSVEWRVEGRIGQCLGTVSAQRARPSQKKGPQLQGFCEWAILGSNQ